MSRSQSFVGARHWHPHPSKGQDQFQERGELVAAVQVQVWENCQDVKVRRWQNKTLREKNKNKEKGRHFYTKCPPSRSHWEDRNKEEDEEEDQGHEGESEEELSLTFSEVGIVNL